MERLLPLGSVLKLKNSPSIIMIVGYFAVDQESKKMKQYIGVSYPLGLSEKLKYIIFNQGSIEITIHEGYEDEKVIENNKKLVELANNYEMK